jgi:hypothetical protein
MKIPLALLTLALSACTTGDIYDSLQDHAQDRCRRLPDTDRAACLARVSTDHDSYKKQRDKAAGRR